MIKEKYGVPSKEIRAYFHYYPSYYHLHVHFNHVKYDVGGIHVGKAHLLSEVIDNKDFGSWNQRERSIVAIVAEDYLKVSSFWVVEMGDCRQRHEHSLNPLTRFCLRWIKRFLYFFVLTEHFHEEKNRETLFCCLSSRLLH